MPIDATDTELQRLIDLGACEQGPVRDVLIDHACSRLLRLTRKMFRSYPKLRRWEQTDDVFQNALIRLHRALSEVQVESVTHFFNLAAVQVRRELLDLAKHHFGPHGIATNHHTDSQPADDAGGSLDRFRREPKDMNDWTEFHNQVQALPEDEREVVNLLWYEGLTQEETARLLGLGLENSETAVALGALSAFSGPDAGPLKASP